MPNDKNLWRHANGTYYARIQVNGRDVRKSLRTTDVRAARKLLKKVIEQAANRRAGIAEPEKHTWEEAVVRWSDLQMADLRPGTQKRYLTSLGQIHPYFSGRDVASITSVDVHDYTVARRRKGASSATVRRDLTIMSRVMRVAKRAGWISANPVPEEMEEIPERREPIRPVPIRALAKLTRRAPPGFRDLIRFLARTGCRQEEGASLEWSQLDLRSVPATCTFSRTKTRSPRVIELTARLADDLRRMPHDPDSPYVFRSPAGKRYTNVPGRFRVLVRKALGEGEDVFRCHDLRHTYAIRALQQKTPIYDVARQLGHSSVKTTEMYAGWLSRSIR